MPEVTITLSQEDFRKIVAGRAIDVEVKLRGIQWWIRIGLKEIDIPKMVEALRDAMDGMGHGEVEGKSTPDKKAADSPPQSQDQDAGRTDQRPKDGAGD